jgi:hypothetical protein
MVKGHLHFWTKYAGGAYTEIHHYKLEPAVVVNQGGGADRKHESCKFMGAKTAAPGPANDPDVNVYLSLFKSQAKGNRPDHRLVVRFKYGEMATKSKDDRGTYDCCDDEPDDDVLQEEEDPGNDPEPPPDPMQP